jgi:hypothetical protein
MLSWENLVTADKYSIIRKMDFGDLNLKNRVNAILRSIPGRRWLMKAGEGILS